MGGLTSAELATIPGRLAATQYRRVGLTRRQLLGELQVLLAYLDWRLSGVPASRTTVATPTGTSTRPDLAAPTHGPAASVIRRVTGLARRNRER